MLANEYALIVCFVCLIICSPVWANRANQQNIDCFVPRSRNRTTQTIPL
jgi:hypothetical protein